MPFPIDSKYIELAEHELKIQFPTSFKKKMPFENGGEVITNNYVWQLIPFFDKSDKKRISRNCNHIV